MAKKVKFWVYLRALYAPALTSLTAHSCGEMPCMSPSGPIHREAATGFPVSFSTSTAHTASSTCSKYCQVKHKLETHLAQEMAFTHTVLSLSSVRKP